MGTYATFVGDLRQAAVFVAQNIKAGPNTVDVAFDQSCGGTITFAEYTGAVSVSPIEDFSSQVVTVGDPTVSLTTTNASDIVALFYYQATSSTVSPPAGFTLREANSGLGLAPDALVFDDIAYWDKVIATPGTNSYGISNAGHGGHPEVILWGVALTNTSVAPTLVSIAITRTSPSVSLGLTQQFTAIGTYSDSSTADITASVTWASSAPSKATIASGGLATSVAGGSTNVTASLSAITSNTAVLTVTLFSISGNAGIAGALVSWTGTASGNVTADGSGNFSITGLVPGTYVVTPTLSGHHFAPTGRSETISGANISGVTFLAAHPTSYAFLM